MHGLDFNQDSIARFAYVGIHKPWHHEGVDMPVGADLEVAIAAADMDYQIEKAPLFAKVGNEFVAVPSHNLVYRDVDGAQLSVMGKDYRPIQVREAFGILDELIEGGELSIETLGTLNGGKRTFICTSIAGDPLQVVPGDMMERYFLAADSYDGTLALTFKSVATLVVCQNTLGVALNENGRKAKAKHTRGVMSANRIALLRDALGIAQIELEEFAKFGNRLAAIRMSNSEVDDFHKVLILGRGKEDTAIEDLTGQQRRALGELDYMNRFGPGQEIEGREGTAWGALNSVTAWTTHMKRHRGNYKIDRTQFSIFGKGDTVNRAAQQLLVNQYQLAA